MIRSIPITLLLIALAVSPNALPAQEWTRFRGPNGSGEGQATTIPTNWTEQDVLWNSELPGIGHSSPVLWGEKIFLLSADPKSGTRYVLCLSAEDGRLLWKRDYAATSHATHQQNSLASSTPTVDAERVYCAWATPEEFTLLALSHDGNEIWRANLGTFKSAHGFGSSPIVYGDLVIIADEQDGESFVLAVDRATGLARWKMPRQVNPVQNTSYATPCLLEPRGGTAELIVASWAHGISSLDPRSGQTNWETKVLPRRPVGSPIVVGGLILANCGEGSGNNNVVALRPGDGAGRPAEVVYTIDRTWAPYVPSLIARDRLVFLWGDRGIVTCIDLESGEIRWRERVGGNYSSSPVRVGECVYCVSSEGEVVTLAAKDKFEVLGRSSLGEASRATPAVALGRMFFRTESHLLAIGRK